MYKKWERQAGIEYGIHKRICQLHFNDGCFKTNEENFDSTGKQKNILSLKKDAIPTKFNFGPPKTSRRLGKSCEIKCCFAISHFGQGDTLTDDILPEQHFALNDNLAGYSLARLESSVKKH